MTSAQPMQMTRRAHYSAEPGMVLTIGYNATGATETFLLGRSGAECADLKVYSMASPLGRAIVGAVPGEQRFYPIPDETPQLVTLVKAVPYGSHVRGSARRRFRRVRKRNSAK